MQGKRSETAFFVSDTKKEPAFLQVLMELMTGFEPVTSSLPRMRSTD